MPECDVQQNKSCLLELEEWREHFNGITSMMSSYMGKEVSWVPECDVQQSNKVAGLHVPASIH